MDKESKYIGLNESPPGEEKGEKLAYQSSPSSHKDPEIVTLGRLEKYHQYKPKHRTKTKARSQESIFRVDEDIGSLLSSWGTVHEIENPYKLGKITTDIKTNQMNTRFSVDKKGQKLAYKSSPSSHEDPQIVKSGELEKYKQYKPIPNTNTIARSQESILSVKEYIEPLPWNTLRNEEKLREIIPDIKINQMKTRLSVLPDTENTATVLNKCSKLMLDIAPRAVKKSFLHAHKHVPDLEFRALQAFGILNSSQRDDLNLHAMVILLLKLGGKLPKISLNDLQRHFNRLYYQLHIPNNADKSLRGALLNIDYYHRWFLCVNKQNIARTELTFMWQTITEAVVRIAGKDFLSEIEILTTSQKCDSLEIPDKDIARGIDDSIDSSSTQSKKKADKLMSISQQVADDNTLQTLSKSETHHAESCTSESFEEKQANYLKMVPLLETEYDTKGKVKSSELASLFETLREGDVKIVESELIDGTHLNVCDDNGVTPLHVACQHGHINVVKLLLQHGVIVNRYDNNGVTPLHVVCQHGRTDIIKLLLQHRVIANRRNGIGLTPLHVACQHGHTDTVKILLQCGAAVRYCDNNGVTPLHVACQHGHTDTVKFLLQHKVDVNGCDYDGVTPLHVACQHGHTDTVKLLLQHEVDVNGCDNNKVTPLHVACQHGHTDTVKLLLQDGVDVNGCDYNGVTPLHVACHGHTGIVELLLQHEVDVNGCDNNGVTPLHVACQHGHTDTVKLLLQHGVDVNGCDNNGVTPLHVACHGHTGIVELLLQHEVDVNRCDPDGATPLHVACQHGHINIVKLLLLYGALVQCCDSDRVTPLHVALQIGNMELVEVLSKMDGKQKFANQEKNIKGDIYYGLSEIDRIQKIFDKIDISVPASKRQYVVPQGKLFHIYFIHSSDKSDTIWVESIIKSIEKRGFKCCKKLANTMNKQTFEQVEYDSCAICLVLSRCFIDKERECLKFWLLKHFKGLAIQLCGCKATDLFLDANCQEHIKWYEILLEYLKYIDVQNVSVIANEMFNCNPSTAFRVRSSATGAETIEILILTDKLEKPILTTILENRVKITNPKIVSRESSVILGKSQQKSQLTREEMITAKRVIQANSDQLFQNHRNLNIITTSNVRSKQGGEEVISEPCIVLHCYCKGLIPEEETEFPTYLKWENDQLPVDVREGFFEFGPRYNTDASTNYHEKLKMGCGFGIVDSKLEGTVGPFLKCYGGVGFLTCAHATCDVKPDNYHYRNKKLKPGYCFHQGKRFLVLQPPPNTFKNSGHNLNTEVCAVGEVYEAIFKPNCLGKKESSIDVGVVKITNQKRIPQSGEFAVISESNLNSANFKDLPLFEGSVITDPLLIDTDARIVKFGMTTHVTRGILNSNGTVVRSNIGGLRSANHSSYVSTFQNQYEVGSISTCPIFFQGGDSGSGVFQVEKRGDKEILHLIGLAIGFTSYFSAIVTPIKDIMDALQIDAGAFNLSQELSLSGASSSSAT